MGEMKKPAFEVIRMLPGEQLDGDGHVGQMMPIRLFVLPNGAIDETPSYAWQIEDAFGGLWIVQITDNMLIEGLRVAGELRERMGR